MIRCAARLNVRIAFLNTFMRPLGKSIGLPAAMALSLGAGAAADPGPAPAGGCYPLQLIAADSGRPVVGAEDIAVDPQRRLAYLSAHDRRAFAREFAADGPMETPGGIYALPLDRLGALARSGTALLKRASRSFQNSAAFWPHGMDFYRDGTGRAVLFVVNRRAVVRAEGLALEPAIEIFDATSELIHRETLTDPLICSPNDLAATGPRSFYFTNDHGACDEKGRWWEDLFGSAHANVVHYDGQNFQKVAGNISYANGIAAPRKGTDNEKRLYVSATRENALRVYNLDRNATADTAELAPHAVISLDGAPDNLQWSDDGDLLVAVHPSLLKLAAYRGNWLGRETAPSRVLQIDPEKIGPAAVETLFEDDGDGLSGATVAAAYGDWIILGTAFEDRLMLCRKPMEASHD